MDVKVASLEHFAELITGGEYSKTGTEI